MKRAEAYLSRSQVYAIEDAWRVRLGWQALLNSLKERNAALEVDKGTLEGQVQDTSKDSLVDKVGKGWKPSYKNGSSPSILLLWDGTIDKGYARWAGGGIDSWEGREDVPKRCISMMTLWGLLHLEVMPSRDSRGSQLKPRYEQLCLPFHETVPLIESLSVQNLVGEANRQETLGDFARAPALELSLLLAVVLRLV
ncbi:hypothetical protein Tco_0020099 [Tanacetum coccineum]